MVFLQETKCSRQKLEELGKRVGKHMERLVVEGNGTGGGLAIFWTPGTLHLLNAEATKSFMSLEMKVLGEKRHLSVH